MATRIFGIDPGLNFTGWAVIDFQTNDRFDCIAFGTIKTSLQKSHSCRLHHIFFEISSLLKKHTPSSVGIENTYVNVNNSSSLKLSQAKAAALIAVAENHLEISEYPAKKVKKTITGVGNADKSQMLRMIKLLLPNINNLSSDEGDALGIAICHGMHLKTLSENAIYKS